MSLDIERMMMQQMFNEWMLKIWRKQPFRGVPLKRSFLKKVKSWKRPAYIFIFLKNCRWKACSLAKNNSFNFFFKDFALYVLRFLNILKIFILQNTISECLLVEATLKIHQRCSVKYDVLKSFTNSTGRLLYRSPFLIIKFEGWHLCFY